MTANYSFHQFSCPSRRYAFSGQRPTPVIIFSVTARSEIALRMTSSALSRGVVTRGAYYFRSVILDVRLKEIPCKQSSSLKSQITRLPVQVRQPDLFFVHIITFFITSLVPHPTVTH